MSKRPQQARVRPATNVDSDEIVRVSAASWRVGFRDILPPALQEPPVEAFHELLDKRLRDPASGNFVAVVNGEIRGYVGCGPSRDADRAPRTAELYTLYVDPNAWRRGIGRSLIAVGLGYLRSREFQTVTLWTFARTPAVMLYEAEGFAADGATQRRRQFGNVLEARYRRALQPEGSL